MWIRIKHKRRHEIVSFLVKEPRVHVYTAHGYSFIHFEEESKRRAFIVWLVDEGIPYTKVSEPHY